MENLANGVYNISLEEAVKAVNTVPLQSWVRSEHDVFGDEKRLRIAECNGLKIVLGNEKELLPYLNSQYSSYKPPIVKLVEHNDAIRLRIYDEENPHGILFDHADRGGEISVLSSDLIKRLKENYLKSALEKAKGKFNNLLSQAV